MRERIFAQEEDRMLREPINEEEFYIPTMRVLKTIGLENIFEVAAKAEKCAKCGDTDDGLGNGEYIKGKWYCEYCKHYELDRVNTLQEEQDKEDEVNGK